MPQEALVLTTMEKLMLKELSANSRVSLTHLAKVAGCSTVKAGMLLDKLIKELDMRFTLEVDMNKLGLDECHILFIRFEKKPSEAFLTDLFRDDPYAQNVYITEGGFDLVIFAAADTPRNYIEWETALTEKLSDYVPELRPSDFMYAHLGYIPLNGAFVNFVREDIKVDRKDRLILQLLNENARTSYREMSKKLGINEDTIRYRVFRLIRKGIIRRFTIAVQKASGALIIYFARYAFNKYTISDLFPIIRKHNMGEIENLSTINSTPCYMVMSGSYRICALSFARTKDEALSFGLKWYANLLRNNRPHIVHADVVRAVKGLLPLRNLDAKQYYSYLWT